LREKGEKSAVPRVPNKNLRSSKVLKLEKKKKRGTSDALKIGYLSSKIISKVANQEVMMMMMMMTMIMMTMMMMTMMMVIMMTMMTIMASMMTTKRKKMTMTRTNRAHWCVLCTSTDVFLSAEKRVPPYGRNPRKDEEGDGLCWG
jgi:anaerobic ribonucleoside-triphosphate reductase